MTTTIIVRDMGRPPGLNEIKGMHFRKYKQVRESWEMRLIALQVPDIETPCRLEFTVYSSRPMDWDNACACVKIPLDALQRIGKLAEDDPAHIVSFAPRQERCKRKDAGIKMAFEPVEGDR